MEVHKEAKGSLLIITQALLWGLFPVMTIISFHSLPPLVTLAGTTFFSALFFACIITLKRRWKEVQNKEAIQDLLFTALLLGVGYYFFYFLGLKYTSAGNVSIIALSETFFSYLFFNAWKKEHYSRAYVAGTVCMIIGALTVLLPNVTDFRLGDMSILFASFIAPLGNFFQRRARQKVSSETVLFVRAAVTVPAVVLLAYVLGERVTGAQLNQGLALLVVSGICLMGVTKMFWVEGIHRISITKANALSAVTPVFTILFSFLILRQSPTPWQLLSLVPIAVGMYLLNRNGKVSEKSV